MTPFLIDLAIVLTVFAMCVNWSKAFHDLYYDGLVPMARTIGRIVSKPINAYTYTGKHRNNVRQPTDSEVDRWNELWADAGADDKFADFLHTLNADLHMNDQARA
jgi:hypothetical protein